MNSLRFKYREKIIDLGKKFLDIADENDKIYSAIVILVNEGHRIKVNFLYNNINSYQIDDCFKEDKIIDILNVYANKISKNINDLNFYYNENKILVFNQTFNKLISKFDETYNNENTNISFFNDEIHITVIDKNTYASETIKIGPEKLKKEEENTKEEINTKNIANEEKNNDNKSIPEHLSCFKGKKKCLIIIITISI